MLRLLSNVSPEIQYYIKIIVGFGSYIVLPILGFVSYSKIRVSPVMALFCVVWTLLGVFSIGGGVTPMGPGDIVTPEQRHAWFAHPWVHQILRIWLTGLAIGIPITAVTWVFEHEKLSKPVKLILKLIKFAAFPFGVWKFIQIFYQ